MVLIVDDDRVLADRVSASLRTRGWEARNAYDCAEARAALLEVTPRLLVLDLQLPDGLGWDLLAELRAGPLAPDVPVVVISSLPVSRREVRERGIAAFLPKPFGMPQILETVRSLAPPHPPLRR